MEWVTEDDLNVVITPSAREISFLTMTERDQNVWKAILQFVLPGAVLAAGFAVWIVRRKRKNKLYFVISGDDAPTDGKT